MTGSVTIKARAFNKVNKGRQRKNEESYARDLSGARETSDGRVYEILYEKMEKDKCSSSSHN